MQIPTSYIINGIEWGRGVGVERIGEWLHINFVVGQSWKYNDVSDSNDNA